MKFNLLFLMKLSTILLIVFVFVLFSITKSNSGKSLPPLTLSHQFEKCPFEIELPGKTSGAIRANRETAEFLDENFWVSAGCSIHRPENYQMLAPDELAKDFLTRRMSLRIYKNYKIVPLHVQSNTAQIRYEALTQINENNRMAYGIIHVIDNFVLDIEVIEKSGNLDIETLNPLFQSVDYSHTD